ncbi:hypothetical protein GBA52_027064 [Prunus armeniaca]|nr:hypothetical protein GBA52_027064 [Prunus armeniaca]
MPKAFSGGRRWMRLRVEGEKKGGDGRRLREGGDEVSEEMGARINLIPTQKLADTGRTTVHKLASRKLFI